MNLLSPTLFGVKKGLEGFLLLQSIVIFSHQKASLLGRWRRSLRGYFYLFKPSLRLGCQGWDCSLLFGFRQRHMGTTNSLEAPSAQGNPRAGHIPHRAIRSLRPNVWLHGR